MIETATEVRTTVFDIQKNTEVRYQRIWTGTWRGYKTRYVTYEYEGTVPTDLGPVPSAVVDKGTLKKKPRGTVPTAWGVPTAETRKVRYL